jgi:hypothetical protein
MVISSICSTKQEPMNKWVFASLYSKGIYDCSIKNISWTSLKVYASFDKLLRHCTFICFLKLEFIMDLFGLFHNSHFLLFQSPFPLFLCNSGSFLWKRSPAVSNFSSSNYIRQFMGSVFKTNCNSTFKILGGVQPL